MLLVSYFEEFGACFAIFELKKYGIEDDTMRAQFLLGLVSRHVVYILTIGAFKLYHHGFEL